MLDIKREIWNLEGWGARTVRPDTGDSIRGLSDRGSFSQGGVALHPWSCGYGRRFGSRRSGAGPQGSTLVESSPALGLPSAPPVQGAGAEQEFPVRGDSTGAALRCVPRLRARHLRRARAERNWEVEDSLARAP